MVQKIKTAKETRGAKRTTETIEITKVKESFASNNPDREFPDRLFEAKK